MTGINPSPAPLLTRASFSRRLVALLSVLMLNPRGALASERKRKGSRQVGKTRYESVDAILFYGQSNAGGGGHSRSILTAPVSPDRVFSFITTQQIYGTKLLDPGRLDGLGPVHDDPKSPPYPATAMAYSLTHSPTGTPDGAYFMHTVWYGSQPLTSFLRGTTSWSDLLAVALRMRQALAERSLRGRVAALVLIQGESGPPGRENYARVLHEFLDQVLLNLKSQTGQERSPIGILLQTNTSNSQPATAPGVALAQWDVAQARSKDIVLAGPMYQFPLGDAVHQSAEGRMMLGDLLALVFETRFVRNQPFEPLHPVSARRVNDTVIVSFKRPSDSLGLQWDETWLSPVPNYGFQVRGETDPAPIIAVEITGKSEVTITLAPQASRRGLIVGYAVDQPRKNGWAPGRGQLTAPTRRRTAFAGLGAKIPDTVAHYAIRFELPVQ